MAIVAKSFSDLLGLKVTMTAGQLEAGKPIPELDLDSLHKYSLHWVSTDGSVVGAPKAIPKPTSSKAIVAKQAVPASGTSADQVSLTVKTLTGKSTQLSMSTESRISDLKVAIQEKESLQNNAIKLLYHNKNLEDEATLQQSNIATDSTLFMIVSVEQIAPSFRMNEQTFLDPQYDYQYGTSDGTNRFSRGNRNFVRPCGWTKKALRVLGKYGDDSWLNSNIGGSWPVAYHGTRKEDAEALCKQLGAPITRGRLFKPGKGIYTTASPIVAERQAETFVFEGVNYKMIFMDRINMDYTAEYQIPGRANETFFVSEENSVRPYCVLVKKV